MFIQREYYRLVKLAAKANYNYDFLEEMNLNFSRTDAKNSNFTRVMLLKVHKQSSLQPQVPKKAKLNKSYEDRRIVYNPIVYRGKT